MEPEKIILPPPKAKPKSREKMIKINICFTLQEIENIGVCQGITGLKRSELIRRYVSKGAKDDIDHHIFKKEVLSP